VATQGRATAEPGSEENEPTHQGPGDRHINAKTCVTALRMSLARRSSRFSRSSSAMRQRSSVVVPGLLPLSISAADPVAKRLGADAELAGDLGHDAEAVAAMRDRLVDHSNRPFTQLGRVPLLSGMGWVIACRLCSILSKRWSIHQTQGGSRYGHVNWIRCLTSPHGLRCLRSPLRCRRCFHPPYAHMQPDQVFRTALW
jgi:hypothetical protein